MRKLKLDEIDFRVGTVGKSANGAYCTILAYKDARVDMTVLDEVFGQERWQNEYKRDSKGVLQCGIGVHFETVGWVWKWSNGIESNTEKQKGEYSDAFKRAGFMWGIGRELYDVPTLFVNLNEGEFFIQGDKVKVKGNFKPNKFKWEMTDKHIRAVDSKGVQRVYAKFDDVQTAPPKKQTAPPQTPAKKEELKPNTDKWTKAIMHLVDGGLISQIEAKYALSEVNRQLLMDEALK